MASTTFAKLQAVITADNSQLNAKIVESKALLGNFSTEAASKIGHSMTMVGAAIVGGLGIAVKVGADFESKLNSVANNTTMTTADIALMEQTIKSMGATTSAPMSQLADGFMHISNFGFSARDSVTILDAAMKSAVATGAEAGQTANILAAIMHSFSIPVNQAAHAMNMLHLAAAMGNMTLEQFNDAAGPAFAMAAALGVHVNDAAAAMSALTRHGFNAAEASTQVRNMMIHIAHPISKVTDLLTELSAKTGVDLVHDFSQAGLAGKGLHGVIDDIALAAQRAHMNVGDLTMRLVVAQRGGLGAAVLGSVAKQDFAQIGHATSSALAGQVDPLGAGFARTAETTNYQLGVLRNNLVLLSSDVQKALVPALIPLVNFLRILIQGFMALPAPIKNGIVLLTALGGAALLILGPILSIAGSIATFVAAAGGIELVGPMIIATFTGAIPAIISFGTALWAALAPILPVILGIAAVIGIVALAWTNDWGHIREVTQTIVGGIVDWFRTNWPLIVVAVLNAITSIQSGWAAFCQAMVNFYNAYLAPMVKAVVDLFISLWPTIGPVLQVMWKDIVAGFTAAWNWIVELTKAVIAIIVSAWSALKPILVVLLNSIVIVIKDVFEILSAFFRDNGTTIKNIFINTWNIIKGAVVAIVGTIFNLIMAIVHVFQGDWAGAWNSLKAAWSTLWHGLWDIIKNSVQLIINTLILLANSMVSTIKNVVPKMLEIGRNILQGLWNGLKAGFEPIIGLVTDIGHSIMNAFRSSTGVHSPSILTEEIGVNLMQGLLIGIQGSSHSVFDMVFNTGKVVVNSMERSFKNESQRVKKLGNKLAEDFVIGFQERFKALDFGVFSTGTGFAGILKMNPMDFLNQDELLKELESQASEFRAKVEADQKLKDAFLFQVPFGFGGLPMNLSFMKDQITPLIEKFDELRNSSVGVGGAWEQMLGNTKPLIDMLTRVANKAREIQQTSSDIARGITDATISGLQGNWKAAGDVLTTMSHDFMKRFTDNLLNGKGQLQEQVQGIISWLSSKTNDFWGLGTDFGGALITSLADGIMNGGDKLKSSLKQVMSQLGSYYGDMIPGLGPFGAILGGLGGSWLGDILGGLFAEGGRPPLNKLSIIGENGPELWMPDSAGTIIPNGGFGFAGAGGGVGNVQVFIGNRELEDVWVSTQEGLKRRGRLS